MLRWIEIEEKEIYWEPVAEEDFIEGVIIRIDDKDFGKQAVIENVKDDKVYITPSHKNLQGKLEDLEVGEKVKVTYKMSKPTKKGNDYMIYKVEAWRDTVASAEKQ